LGGRERKSGKRKIEKAKGVEGRKNKYGPHRFLEGVGKVQGCLGITREGLEGEKGGTKHAEKAKKSRKGIKACKRTWVRVKSHREGEDRELQRKR